jgi:hypothetical protein
VTQALDLEYSLQASVGVPSSRSFKLQSVWNSSTNRRALCFPAVADSAACGDAALLPLLLLLLPGLSRR